MKTSEIDLRKLPLFDLWKEAGRVIDVEIAGSSMRPFIRPGDTISLRPMGGHELKMGDLITFWQDGNLIVHRFIKRRMVDKTVRLCQKGDNLSGWSWIPADEVLGKVVSIRGLGKQMDINTRLWNWVNRAMGISGFLWVSTVEKTRLLKKSVAPDWQLPVLGGLVGRAGRVLNSTYGFIIIKTVGTRGRKS